MGPRADPDSRVTMICPNLSCRRTLSAPASARGKIMRCAYCNAPFRVPERSAPDSEATAAAHEVKKR
jgi:hypothetical protein